MKTRFSHIYAYPLAYELVYGRDARDVAREVATIGDVLGAAKVKGYADVLELGSGPKSKYEALARIIWPAVQFRPTDWVTADREKGGRNHVRVDFFQGDDKLPGSRHTLSILPYWLLQTVTAADYATPTVEQLTGFLRRLPGTILGHVCVQDCPEEAYLAEKFDTYRREIWVKNGEPGQVEERIRLTISMPDGKRQTLEFEKPFVYNHEAAIRAVQKLGRKVRWYIQEEDSQKITPIRGRPWVGVPGDFWYVVEAA